MSDSLEQLNRDYMAQSLCEYGRCGNFARGMAQKTGGYNMWLCTYHMNEWRRFALNRPEFMALVRAEAQLQRATVHSGMTDVNDSLDDVMVTTKALYDLAERWFIGKGMEPDA